VQTIEKICKACDAAGVRETTLLNFVVSDGTSPAVHRLRARTRARAHARTHARRHMRACMRA
jgi:hypothetical protein